MRSLKNELLVEEYAEHSTIYPSDNFRLLWVYFGAEFLILLFMVVWNKSGVEDPPLKFVSVTPNVAIANI